MAVNFIEAKSETGRSGARVEFDSSTNAVKITGFYDTYVKLNLKKNEWTLEQFLDKLGILDALEKKRKAEEKMKALNDADSSQSSETIETKVESKKVEKKAPSKKVAKISAKIEKPKVSKETIINTKNQVETKEKVRPKKVEYNIEDKCFNIELENLKSASVIFKYRKEKPDAEKGSIYMFVTHSGTRIRFVPKGFNSIMEESMDIGSKTLNKNSQRFSEINEKLDTVIGRCKEAFKDIEDRYKQNPTTYNSGVELENVKNKITA